MSPMDLQRAEGFREILEELIEENASAPIIVEGERDLRALRRIGVAGIIIIYNRGEGVVPFCESTAREHRRVIMLMDWDRSGSELHEAISRNLEALDVQVEDGFWIRLGRYTGRAVNQVEGLASFYLELLGHKGGDPLENMDDPRDG